VSEGSFNIDEERVDLLGRRGCPTGGVVLAPVPPSLCPVDGGTALGIRAGSATSRDRRGIRRRPRSSSGAGSPDPGPCRSVDF
jgi:hypothetical protein